MTTEIPITASVVLPSEDTQHVDPNVVYTIKDLSTQKFLRFHNGEIHWGPLVSASLFDHLGAVSTIVLEHLDCLHHRYAYAPLRCEV
jgi:hypothetical protein